MREGLWGLSLLFTDPSTQSAGVGRELLARAHAYGEGARGWVILSSADPRAMRAYARLGLALHPGVSAVGPPRDAAMPGEVRIGGPQDLPLTEAVDRSVRGAAHGADILAMLEAGSDLLVVPERGYVVVKSGEVRLLAAFDEESAATLLRGALAHAAEALARVRRLDHGVPAMGAARLPRRAVGAARELGRGVPRRRRRPVPALSAERGVPMSRLRCF